MEIKQSNIVLRDFTEKEIKALCTLREAYREKRLSQNMAEQRRLEFARWLVATGRMTDQVR